MQTEFEYALMKENLWRHHLGKFDSGSYCEEASNEWKSVQKVFLLYKQLADALLEFDRSGIKPPTVGL